MFFKDGERLIINNAHPDYQRYNEISRGIYTSKIGEMAVDNVYRIGESKLTAPKRMVEFSLWRVTDTNVNAEERGIDKSEFVLRKPGGERISYVVVPRMNTDEKDARPLEYTDKKDATFEDIEDPRVVVIARAYKGIIAEIAKDLVSKNEVGIRKDYKFLTSLEREEYSEFSNPDFLRALTAKAVEMFEPNVYLTFHPEEQPHFDGYAYVDPIMQLVKDQKILSNATQETLSQKVTPEIETQIGHENDGLSVKMANEEQSEDQLLSAKLESTDSEHTEEILNFQISKKEQESFSDSGFAQVNNQTTENLVPQGAREVSQDDTTIILNNNLILQSNESIQEEPVM